MFEQKERMGGGGGGGGNQNRDRQTDRQTDKDRETQEHTLRIRQKRRACVSIVLRACLHTSEVGRKLLRPL